MGSGKSLDAELGQHPIELATRATIRIGNEEPRIAVLLPKEDFSDSLRNPLGAIMEFRRQTDEVEMTQLRPSEQDLQFAGNRSTRNDEALSRPPANGPLQ